MVGSGCKSCPVKGCDTLRYRGSRCAALRAEYGLGDPLTNADRIRSMCDEELAKFMFSMVDCVSCENKLMNNGKLVFGDARKRCNDTDWQAMCNGDARKCEGVCLAWLQQPVEQ